MENELLGSILNNIVTLLTYSRSWKKLLGIKLSCNKKSKENNKPEEEDKCRLMNWMSFKIKRPRKS